MELPCFTVGVEDAISEEIAEGTVYCETFTIARKVGFENVLDDRGVGRENLAGAEGTVEDEGGGRDGVEDVGDPVDAAVEVG